MFGWNAGVIGGVPGPKVRLLSPLAVNAPKTSITTSVGAEANTQKRPSVTSTDETTRFATSRPGPKLTLDVLGVDPHGNTVRKPGAADRVASTFTTTERASAR